MIRESGNGNKEGRGTNSFHSRYRRCSNVLKEGSENQKKDRWLKWMVNLTPVTTAEQKKTTSIGRIT